MVIGVAGTRMKFIQKITPICGSYNKDGSIASSSLLDPSAVGVNPGFRLECARGRVATKLRVAFNDEFRVVATQGQRRMHVTRAASTFAAHTIDYSNQGSIHCVR